jgi:hypothetical protein
LKDDKIKKKNNFNFMIFNKNNDNQKKMTRSNI